MATDVPRGPDAQRVAQRLASIPLFASLPVDQLVALAERGQVGSLPSGATVVQEGDRADALYVLLAGSARVYMRHADGSETQLAQQLAGSYFGELALLDGQPRSAWVVTTSPAELFVLPRADFLELLPRAPRALAALFAKLSADVRQRSQDLFEEELRRRQVQTEMELARYRALGQMVAGVAHEVNTPLGIVSTAVSIVVQRIGSPAFQALRGHDPDLDETLDDLREATSLMERNIQRAHRLINDFKKLAAGQLVDQKEMLLLPEVVQEVVDLFKIEARKAQLAVAVRSTLASPEDGQWQGYRGLLTQVLMNLLTNVQRYGYPDGRGGAVEVLVSAAGGDFVIQVRDFGAGIPPEALEHVFSPFFTTGRDRGGTGLGLAIVHNIVVNALKGTVDIASTPGHGTTVTVHLPRVVPDAPTHSADRSPVVIDARPDAVHRPLVVPDPKVGG
jgi:signal transduction histidine kinase